MNALKIVKNQKGIAIEMVIAFFMIIFALCTLILTFLFNAPLSRKASEATMKNRADISQIGEYFVRAVAGGGVSDGHITWPNDADCTEFINRIGSDCTFETHTDASNNYTLQVIQKGRLVLKLTVRKTPGAPGAPSTYQIVSWSAEPEEIGEGGDTPTFQYYTVSFDTGGAGSLTAQVIVEGGSFPLPGVHRDGFVLLGWFASTDGTDKVGDVGDSYSPSSSTTLYAHWKTAVSCTVTYDANGGTCATASETFTGTALILPLPERTGYDFIGWSDGNNTFTAGAPYTPAKNITLQAQWKAKQYSVDLDKNGTDATLNKSSIAVSYGETYAALDDVTTTRSGYDFAGWFTASNGGTQITKNTKVTKTDNHTLYAHWTPRYTVTYSANGGTGTPNAQTVSAGASINLGAAPTRAGYRFDGWSDGSQTYTAGASYTVKSNVTMTAIWVEQRTVSYDVNGGTSSTPGATTLDAGRSLNLASAPTRTGCTFAGWSDGNNTYSAGASYTPAKNVILQAQWNTSVSFTAGDGGSVSPTSLTVPLDAKITVSGNTVTINSKTVTASANSNYEFEKWNVSNGDTVTVGQTIRATFQSTGGGGCVAAGTLVTLSDGSYKKVEDLTLSDTVLAFDHENGGVVTAPVNFIEADGWKSYTVTYLVWSDGTTSRIIDEHGFFDLDAEKYVYIHPDDFDKFIGHRFYAASYRNKILFPYEVTLIDAYNVSEYTGCYEFPSVYHLDFFMEDKLSMPGGITGMFNIFTYDDDLTYNKEEMAKDITAYHLFAYDNVKDSMTRETFDSYPSKYMYISIGKGLMSEADLAYLIERYAVKYQGVR